jgi:predicted dehydrogenase
VALVAAVDPDAARADEAAKQYGIPVFASIDELLKADLKLDAACVAVPTVKHHEVASALLDAGSICSSRSRWRRILLKPTI